MNNCTYTTCFGHLGAATCRIFLKDICVSGILVCAIFGGCTDCKNVHIVNNIKTYIIFGIDFCYADLAGHYEISSG